MMINCLCCVSQPAEVWLPTKSSLKGWCPLTAGSRMRSLLKSSRPRWPTALDLFSLMRLCSPSLAIWDGLTPGSTRARDVQKLHLPSLAIWQPCLQDLVPLQCQVLWWTLWCHLRWDPPWWHRLLVLRSARSLALLFLGVGFGILFSSFVVSFVVGVWIVNGFSFVASWIESDHVTMWINDAGWTQVGLMSSGVSNPVAKTAPVPPPPRPILSPEGQILPTPAAKASAAAMPSQPEAGVLCVICQSVMGMMRFVRHFGVRTHFTSSAWASGGCVRIRAQMIALTAVAQWTWRLLTRWALINSWIVFYIFIWGLLWMFDSSSSCTCFWVFRDIQKTSLTYRRLLTIHVFAKSWLLTWLVPDIAKCFDFNQEWWWRSARARWSSWAGRVCCTGSCRRRGGPEHLWVSAPMPSVSRWQECAWSLARFGE